MSGTKSSQTPEPPIERIGRGGRPSGRSRPRCGCSARSVPRPRSSPRRRPGGSWGEHRGRRTGARVPSAMRCRSTSPTVGPNRYGSSRSQVLPSSNRIDAVRNWPGARSAPSPFPQPVAQWLHRERPAVRATSHRPRIRVERADDGAARPVPRGWNAGHGARRPQTEGSRRARHSLRGGIGPGRRMGPRRATPSRRTCMLTRGGRRPQGAVVPRISYL